MSPKILLRLGLIELVLTSALLFGIGTIVRWVTGPSELSRAITDVHVRLLLIGGGVAVLIASLIISPLGRMSGGHMNPAVSMAMWLFRAFPLAGVVTYGLGQLCGSLLGILAAHVVWGSAFSRTPVSDAALQPRIGWSSGLLFLTETLLVAVIVGVIALFLITPTLAPRLPWVVGLMFGVTIGSFGALSGGSENPARQFGPALISGQLRFLWVYLLAPVAGSVVAFGVMWAIGGPRRLPSCSMCGGPMAADTAVQSFASRAS